ncbi:MAG: D-2-hydroxyacid dehydrogenase [Spirochaetaceae bacterium]|nr:MAG: D-2-hydroxyacid dehydrogenase [Spirochaetaceae bacterium]
MGYLLYGGSEERLGTDRLAELRRVAAPLQVLVTEDEALMRERAVDIDIAAARIPVGFLESTPGIKWYHHWFAGVEHLAHIPHFHDGSTVVTNASGVHAEPMAEQFFGMLLSFARRLHVHFQNQPRHEWSKNRMDDVFELDGMSMLVVGMGAVGRRIAELGLAFRMQVEAIRRTAVDDIVPVHAIDALGDLLPRFDVVVCILPLTAQTHRIFGRREFDLMKPTAIFSNFGRGKQVDQAALVDALSAADPARRIGGALLDVTDPEPLPKDSPLWTAPNALIAPHVGGFTPRYTERAWPTFIENLGRYHRGEPMLNLIDFELGY